MHQSIKALIENHGQEKVISSLLTMIGEQRLERIENCIQQRLKHIHMACEYPYDIHNAFATIRTSEAFGVYNVHIISNDRIKATGKATTQGAKRWVFTNYYSETKQFFDSLPEDMAVAGACLNSTHSIEDLPIDRPICLLFGNEQQGLSEYSLSRCNYRFKLPMYGMSESFNLSIAGALTLSRVVTRYRSLIKPKETDLTHVDQQKLLAHYLIASFGIQRSNIVLKNL